MAVASETLVLFLSPIPPATSFLPKKWQAVVGLGTRLDREYMFIGTFYVSQFTVQCKTTALSSYKTYTTVGTSVLTVHLTSHP